MEIILIRHGKPAAVSNPVVDVYEYVKWIRRYNLSGALKGSRPESINPLYQSYYLISSDLKEQHIAQIFT
jgi:hypothetical protein